LSEFKSAAGEKMSNGTFQFSSNRGSRSARHQIYLGLIAFLLCSVVLAEEIGLRPPSEEGESCSAGTCGLRPPPEDDASPASDDGTHPADLNKDGTVTTEEFEQFAAETEKPVDAKPENVNLKC
jgi:hypothetical protein